MTRTAVAVTGAGVLCATAADVEGFAAALRAGVRGIRACRPGSGDAGLEPRLAADLRDFDLEASVEARGALPGALRERALAVAARSPLGVQASVVVALQAWEHARLHEAPVPAERLGVVVAGHNLGGRHADELRPRYEASPVYLPARYGLQFLDTDHVGTLSELLGLRGEGCTVGGASASGNVGIIAGTRLIEWGVLDACLVVGALTDLSAMQRQALHNLGAMAGGGAGCRPFDLRTAGFVAGQSAACLVLEPAASAAGRGLAPLGFVAGHAARLDGNRLADPAVAGEAAVMAEALLRAGVAPGRVDYVSAHGTGSPLGDRTELAALRSTLGDDFARPWVNATKGLVGHGLCSAGVVEAVAALLQMRDGFVHPNALLEDPVDPAARLAGAGAEPATIDVALSNAFGFGGFNTSVVLTRREPGP